MNTADVKMASLKTLQSTGQTQFGYVSFPFMSVRVMVLTDAGSPDSW